MQLCEPANTTVTKSLPDLNGPLSSTVKPQAVESANQKVSALLASEGFVVCMCRIFHESDEAELRGS